MKIEVAADPSAANKAKGDLLENFTEEFLHTQNYEVVTQLRVTAAELDLLCRHRVNARTVYVECKAHRETLSAEAPKTILGTLEFKGYDEAWLVSAGPLGKDAKGFLHEWEEKPQAQRQKLSFYTSDRICSAFSSARIITQVPDNSLVDGQGVGDWILLVTPYGRFWAAPILQSGVPAGVLTLDAKTGLRITDHELLRSIGKTDTSLATLDFLFGLRGSSTNIPTAIAIGPEKVVQVEHGESWTDYRPARPQDFVGRSEPQTKLLAFLGNVRAGTTATRVFAITADSGMGKSSLIAKLRSTAANTRNRGHLFVYAIDCRAAANSTYIPAALISGIRAAAAQGFGNQDPNAQVSDHSDPLDSESIRAFLHSLEEQKQVVCIIFDQFEELYSKSDLFSVFEEAQRLFLSAVSASSNLVLGFAWRTDSTVQQDHPAYYMWHRLADHRFQVSLGPLSPSEVGRALGSFERELNERLRPEIRRQIAEISQGYPWLVKKLCIHLYEQLRAGGKQADFAETLDVASLFDRDLQQLTQPEQTCLTLIARSAPADWYEILENSGVEVLRALQDKRLVVRSGDRLNLYWDIFREYVLTKTVPSIPFTYMPSAPSLSALLRVARELSVEHGRSLMQLSAVSGLGEKTVGNVVRDLKMFGIATGEHAAPRLDSAVASGRVEDVLLRIRRVLQRHSLTIELSRRETGTRITIEDLERTLRALNPSPHRAETWRGYAERMGAWLTAAGLLVQDNAGGWKREDAGSTVPQQLPLHRHRVGAFTGDAPPVRAVAALAWLQGSGPQSYDAVCSKGFRNAMLVLTQLKLVARSRDGKISQSEGVGDRAAHVVVWEAAQADETVNAVVALLRVNPAVTGREVGDHVAELHGENWTSASKKRVGGGIRRWAHWITSAESSGEVPIPREGRSATGRERTEEQGSLFSREIDKV